MSHIGSPSGSTDDRSHSPLIRAFDELSRAVPAGADLPTVLERVVALAVSSVQACDEASISALGERGRVSTPCATAQVAVELDNEQYRAGAGPCMSALTGEAPSAYSAEVASDQRWPEFGRTATARGFGSVFSHRFAAGGPVGGINFYARHTNAFSDEDKTAATLLAAFAGAVIALVQERTAALQLREALQSRDVIGQAKGILMERYRITADEAFGRLRVVSQKANRKLAALAEELAATGQWPPEA
jgi:hypothetical protein